MLLRLVAVSKTSKSDSHKYEWDLVAYLSKYATGKSKPSLSTILDRLIESAMHWEINYALRQSCPCLIASTEHFPTSYIRSAVALRTVSLVALLT
jgi:hypothetical protein